MEIVFFSASVFFLFLATLHYLLFLVYRNPVVPRVARFSLYLAFTVQIVFFAARFMGGGIPLGTSLYESLIFFSWCIIASYLLVTVRYKIPAVGAFVIPVAFITVSYTHLRAHET